MSYYKNPVSRGLREIERRVWDAGRRQPRVRIEIRPFPWMWNLMPFKWSLHSDWGTTWNMGFLFVRISGSSRHKPTP